MSGFDFAQFNMLSAAFLFHQAASRVEAAATGVLRGIRHGAFNRFQALAPLPHYGQ